MSISDGTSKTIMLIEASGFGVHWMEPRDLSMDEAIELLTTKPQSGHIHASHGFLTTTYYETSRHVAFCDGYVTYLGQIKDPAVARALLTANGGEEIPADLEERYAPASRTVINWGRVWGLGVFAALSLLPMAWIPQRK